MAERSDFELATAATFDEERYVLANPDIAAFVRAGGDARRHFEDHGRTEGRFQLKADTIARAARKYARFLSILDADRGAGGSFSFVGTAGQFPIAYGIGAHSLGEYESESANPGYYAFNEEIEGNPDGFYLDVGCGRRSWTYDNCLYLEVYPSVSADIIMAPACSYPIASGSLDGIGCFAVLEHVTEPWLVAEEFRRMLKPGGKVFIDWPFLQPVHGYPSHYYNATRSGLQRMFAEGFEPILLDTLDNQTPDHVVRWTLNALVNALPPPERAEITALTVAALIAEQPGDAFWTRMMAVLPDETKMVLACGNTLIARKV